MHKKGSKGFKSEKPSLQPTAEQNSTTPLEPNSSLHPALRSPSLHAIANHLRLEANPFENFQSLQALSAYLQSLPPHEAVRIISEYLQTNEDAPTGLGFIVGPDGKLQLAPTLRVFLLDELEKIDPQAAATLAHEILDSSTSADEWAIALRSLSKSMDEEALIKDSYYTQKINELLHNEAWLKHPTAGYANAFDIVVYRGGDTFVPRLGELIDSGNPAIQHAAALALDRMAMRDYHTTLGAISSDPNFMSTQPQIRASIYARADPRESVELAIAMNHMSRVATNAEKEAFIYNFPNFNQTTSNNLLTPNRVQPLSHNEAAQDAACMALLEQLMGDPQYQAPDLQQALQKRIAQLKGFQESYARGAQQDQSRFERDQKGED